MPSSGMVGVSRCKYDVKGFSGNGVLIRLRRGELLGPRSGKEDPEQPGAPRTKSTS